MKTCKTGCGGKMKAGGSVKKVKKMATGGQALNKAKGFASAQKGGDNVKMGIYGMSNAGTTGPNRTAGYDYKKGGSIKKMKAGGGSDPCPKGYHVNEYGGCSPNTFRTLGSKLGVGAGIAGALGIASKYIGDKIKEKKAAKKEAEEKKKKAAETPKAKFGASVGVKASCKNGMVRGADGKCVMSRPKFKSGGSFGMLSVKAGVDKNPNPTAADRIAGAKMNKKKMGGITRRK
jgi:hypothetical protein